MNKARLNTFVLLALAASTFAGCGTLEHKVKTLESSVSTDIKMHQEKAAEPAPVISSTSAAWLAGAPVQIAEPVLPILTQEVGYHPTKPVSLADVASWVTQTTGLVIDIAELQSTATPGVAGGGLGVPGMAGMPSGLPVTPGAYGTTGGSPQQQQNMYSMYINFDGQLSGLLDVAANKSGAWWKIVDGRASFYRTETKTFYLPAVARKFTGDSTITSSTGGNSASSGATGAVSSGTSSTGGANSVSNYLVDIWADLDKTAKIVGAGAQISVNQSAGSITVTGTPAQVRHVEDWVRALGDQLSQQVAISVRVYSIKLTNEDNYNWNPNVLFKSASGILGYTITGPQSPLVVSGNTPFNLGISVLSNATNTTQYSGSQLAFQALSTLGHVVETINQTVVTLNGQPAPVQIANQQGYLASSSTTLTPNVGATTTLVPGTITTGFTAMFLPRIVNGKVILGMTMTNSTSNGFTSISSGGSTIQNPNLDSNTFQQSVSLTPGDALLLTGLQRENGSASKSGVGVADNHALGGGIDNNLGKQVVAIVITARIM